jgi:hypothetical protein
MVVMSSRMGVNPVDSELSSRLAFTINSCVCGGFNSIQRAVVWSGLQERQFIWSRNLEELQYNLAGREKDNMDYNEY